MNQAKVNLKKVFKEYYRAKTTSEIVEIGEGLFITIEGKGAPESDEFQSKITALYSLAYGIKALMKKEGKDFVVAPLEGLWWTDSDKSFLDVSREEWKWKLLIRIPEFVTSEIAEQAKDEVFKKKGIALVKEIKLKRMEEGTCVQILHIGPYSKEIESLKKMKKLMEKENFIENGPHHEIYLSDPRRVSEEKLRTILRQPVKERM